MEESRQEHTTYDGLEIIADKEKWGGNMTIIEYEAETVERRPQNIHVKTSVCKQSAGRHSFPGFHCAPSLVDRKYALGTGCKSAARQGEAQVGKGRPQP